jgi:hypothetical protein
MSRLLGQRAVVIEAGIGWLSMAGTFDKILRAGRISERNRLTASAA